MTTQEIAERELMKLKPSTRAKFLRLVYALIGKPILLTDFERDVAISLLENAIDGWGGNPERDAAAERVIKKLRQVDRA